MPRTGSGEMQQLCASLDDWISTLFAGGVSLKDLPDYEFNGWFNLNPNDGLCDCNDEPRV